MRSVAYPLDSGGGWAGWDGCSALAACPAHLSPSTFLVLSPAAAGAAGPCAGWRGFPQSTPQGVPLPFFPPAQVSQEDLDIVNQLAQQAEVDKHTATMDDFYPGVCPMCPSRALAEHAQQVCSVSLLTEGNQFSCYSSRITNWSLATVPALIWQAAC